MPRGGGGGFSQCKVPSAEAVHGPAQGFCRGTAERVEFAGQGEDWKLYSLPALVRRTLFSRPCLTWRSIAYMWGISEGDNGSEEETNDQRLRVSALSREVGGLFWLHWLIQCTGGRSDHPGGLALRLVVG